MEAPQIPPDAWASLLPSPSLSITDFLRFPLPNQLPDVQSPLPHAKFYSDQSPDTPATLDILAELPIPSEKTLAELSKVSIDARSIVYAHLHSKSHLRFPTLVLPYWKEVSLLRRHVRQPWTRAIAFVSKFKSRGRDASDRRLCDAVQTQLLGLPWGGDVEGIGDDEPRNNLATYLSHGWLTSAHIEQQLSLLRQELLHVPNSLMYEIVGPDFFLKLAHMYRERESSPYNSQTRSRLHWSLGTDLESQERTKVAGIMLVGGNHWIAIVIDIENSSIRIGDSFRRLHPDVVTVIQWWLSHHGQETFKVDALPVTPQTDGFSCGILSIDALHAFLLPQETSSGLLPAGQPSKLDFKRLEMFHKVVACDSQMRMELQCPDEHALVYELSPALYGVKIVPQIVPLLRSVTSIVPSSPDVVPFSVMNDLPELDDDELPPLDTAFKGLEKPPQCSPLLTPSKPALKRKNPPSSDPEKSGLHQWYKSAPFEVVLQNQKHADALHFRIMEERREEEERKDERSKKRIRVGATERQRTHRANLRELDIQTGKRDQNGKPVKPMVLNVESLTAGSSSPSVAELSRPLRTAKEEKRSERGTVGRPRVNEYKEAKLTYWQSPLLWVHIDRVSKTVGFLMSPTLIVRELQKLDKVLFKKLTTQVVGSWIDRTGTKPVWRRAILDKVACGYRPGGTTTRVGVLTKYPQETAKLIELLQDLRSANVALTTTSVRALMIAHFQHHRPEIFTMPAADGSLFRCSEAFVRKFLDRALNWTMRRATRAGGKLPDDPDSVLFDAFLRIAYNIHMERIVEDLFANSDQTQMVLAQGGTMTYAPIGSRQVTTNGMDEKRAVTVLVTLTNSGRLLPFQTIYKGKSANSLPDPDSPHYQDAIAEGFLFNVSKTATYWSTIDTMKTFVNEILAPYFDRVVVEKKLSKNQRRIWLIDCWSVHRSDEFLTWMALNHPLIIVIFVPARMTGLFQPCDVGFQRIFKHSLKQSAHDDVVEEVLQKFKEGTRPETVTIDTTIKVLRNRTPKWLWVAYKKLNKPDIIKKAWELCRAKTSNLSYESLTSEATLDLIRKLPDENPTFFKELTQPRSRGNPVSPVLSEDEASIEDMEADAADFDADDSSVPLDAVIDLVHKQLNNGVDDAFVEREGGITRNSEAEECLIEEVHGVQVDATGMASAKQGRGCRKKFRNKIYADDPLRWWSA